ncbi:hypothetical protein LOOC260_116240 [Paucilactobacillus hokkaidonensis JCM 18461]|uniref:Uncharacterized protein n=2 Tax=Paucilactobacillus hokkaidonensis TaxID=1193095 RepID=A0A0A1GV88_9LACO|nr:hypothetical protein [Paucilactobacillus hokkaidonensis]KRO08954.1 hypothetical protein IV59_GL001001 [Paucilactobacillus hokkaidonensis]BAP86132.1 hypothetical protein LOOC260_116240 [Paucilactobacillus hokkaidonensis JCM 18461]
MKEKLMQQRQRLQVRLVIWIVTTISFYVIRVFVWTQIVTYIAWLSSAYCLVLFGLIIRISWMISRDDK